MNTTAADLSSLARDLVLDLAPIARLCAGAPDDGAAAIVGIVFRFEDRVVEVRSVINRKSGEHEWAFHVKGRGRGRRPGVHPERLGRDHDAALTDLRTLRDRLRRKDAPTAAIARSPWLRKLALWWTAATAVAVPSWLSDHLTDTWVDPQGGDRKPPQFVVRVSLAALTDQQLTKTIRDPEKAAVLAFEGEPLDVAWNDFAAGGFVPSELAATIVGIFHAQRTGRGKKKPLAPSYVLKQKASRRT
jgi:hypothetical protein